MTEEELGEEKEKHAVKVVVDIARYYCKLKTI